MNTEAPYTLVLTRFVGPQWGRWFSLLIFVVITGTLNSWLLASGQVAKGASDGQLLPSFFGKMNKKGSPSGGLWATCAALSLSLMALSFFPMEKQIDLLITSSVCFLLLIYGLCVLSLFSFMKKNIIPWSFLTKTCGFISLGFSLLALATSSPYVILLSLCIPLMGTVLLFFYPSFLKK